ncbi:MAG: CehA/McbA family metallohydrolase, partial [Gemmataceae bacterium]|nr:CehA/McbA family metallohydrolase [Gemmataceae bacterium]
MLTVHLRINDAATGKLTPVRLRVAGPDGTAYPPLGRFAEFPAGRNEAVGGHLLAGREAWCYVGGSCEVRLPAGVPLRVRAAKGPEYTPLDETVTLGPGQMALRLTIGRAADARADGWVTGDARCHFLPPHAALLEAAAEDLDVVNLLAGVQDWPSIHDGTTYPTAPHLDAFSGQAPALEADGRVVVVNTFNAHPTLGKVGLLNAHRPVFPLAFGGADPDDWSVSDWCDQCHRKGGLAVWVDAFRPAGGVVGGEALVAALLGKMDAIEVDPAPRPQPLLPWVYRLWNAGFPIPLAGGSGKDSNRVALGAVRTYARLTAGEAPSYRAWVEAVRAGRTVVTDGPLLSLEVGGRGPGETVEAAGELTARA